MICVYWAAEQQGQSDNIGEHEATHAVSETGRELESVCKSQTKQRYALKYNASLKSMLAMLLFDCSFLLISKKIVKCRSKVSEVYRYLDQMPKQDVG